MNEHELNARSLEYSEIGEKFVVHPEFDRLVSLDNSIVIGPRGSGKTTMLRMLTPEGLHCWTPKDPGEILIKKGISFIGLYVPMSRIFQDDLERRYMSSEVPVNIKENALHKIYFLNVVESILETVFFFVKKDGLSKQDESTIANKLGQILDADPCYSYKVSSLITFVNKKKLEARDCLVDRPVQPEKRSYKGQLISNVEPILKAVNECFDFRPGQKYAICLDELDVYASDFTTEMIRNLRGISPSIILKLTLAPIHTVTISDFTDAPQQVHDYNKIYLWPNPESSPKGRLDSEKAFYNFSKQLAEATLKDISKKEIDLDQLLGRYSDRKVFDYMRSSESNDNVLKKVSVGLLDDTELDQFIFNVIASRDPKFKKLLKDKKINLDNFKQLSRIKSSSVIRKIDTVIYNRFINVDYEEGKASFKRLRVQAQYHGADVILKAIDGNPRYLKKLMEYLAQEIKEENGAISTIPIAKQARALMKIKDLFLQRIEAIPIGEGRHDLGVGKLVRQIGTYLTTKQNIDTSWENLSVPSYITVPNRREIRSYEDVFRKAINNGALLMLGDNDIAKMNSVRNKELRLNYLLHIEFRMPFHKFYPASFEEVMGFSLMGRTGSLFDNQP